MKRFLSIFVMCTWLSTAIRAQVINGDLNHNDVLDVGDVTMVIDGYLTGEAETIQTGGAPFMVDNSFVVGTWYASAYEKVTFNADGTTDYAPGYTYEFLATQGYILFYNADAIPVYALRVLKATSDCLVVLPTGRSVPVRYTNIAPVSEHEAVDLGLSVKWAATNIGANAPEEYGDYFAWGETKPKDTYSWSTYTLCNGSSTTMTKYCIRYSDGTVDNKTILDLEDDAAHANWGDSWRMPTLDEIEELIYNCNWEWTSLNGVDGSRVTGPNGNSIFLPATGYRYNEDLNNVGNTGTYWLSSLGTSRSNEAYYLAISPNNVYKGSNGGRFHGRSVRPVCK